MCDHLLSCYNMDHRKRALIRGLSLLIPIVAIVGYMCYSGRWVEYVNTDGNFKILFPGQPEESSRHDGGTRVNFVAYDLRRKGGQDAGYMVTYFDYDDSLVKAITDSNMQRIYENELSPILRLGERRLISEKEVYCKHHKGLEVKLDYKQGKGLFTIRMYLAGHTFYMLQACCEASDNSGSANKFLSSFELLH